MWWLVRRVKAGDKAEALEYWKPAARFGFIAMLIGALLVITTGHFMGQHIYKAQPTKMIAAMGISQTEESAPLGLIMKGTELNADSVITLPIPGLESFMVTNHFSGPESQITGADDINKQFQEYFADTYGADQNYLPNPFISFYSFRIMMGLGFASTLLALLGLFVLRKDKLPDSQGLAKLFVWTIPFPYLASTFGWILAEMGRQPWVVYPNFQAQPMESTPPTQLINQLTDYGVSQNVLSIELLASLIIFTLLYLALGIVWFLLVKRYVVEGINPRAEISVETIDVDAEDAKLSFVY